MTIKQCEPRNHREWKIGCCGERIAELYTLSGGIVRLCSYAGDAKQPAFTSLETYVDGRMYYATLPRHYHDRWIPRIAERFAWACGQLSKGKVPKGVTHG